MLTMTRTSIHAVARSKHDPPPYHAERAAISTTFMYKKPVNDGDDAVGSISSVEERMHSG
jgi:hypothetical protein